MPNTVLNNQNNETYNCPICNRQSLIKNEAIKDGEDICVCPHCLENFFIRCPDCGEFHHINDDHYSYRGSRICEYCFNDNYFICEDCGESYHNDSYSGNDGFCNNCHCRNSIDSIQDYSTKAPANFLAKKVIKNNKGKDITQYFGVELEVECGEHNRNLLAKSVREIMGDFIITKHDGSLENGFEIVTIPADFETQCEKWANFLKNKPKGLKSYETSTCGLHIHVSRRPLTALQIGKILVFMNNSANASFIEAVAGREINHFCARKTKKLTDALPKNQSRDRREVVNLTNKETIEFRVFKGTLYKQSLFRYLEFTDCLIKFCAVAENSIAYCRSVPKFIKYVENNKYQYPHLFAFIKTRWLEENWISNDGKTDLAAKYGFPIKKTQDSDE